MHLELGRSWSFTEKKLGISENTEYKDICIISVPGINVNNFHPQKPPNIFIIIMYLYQSLLLYYKLL